MSQHGTSTGAKIAASTGAPKADTEKEPVVQFCTKVFFCFEGAADINLAVLRNGNCERRLQVRYTTKDMTAKAGINFVASTGEVVFEPGERVAQIRVPLLKSSLWEQTLGFMVDLLEEGLEGAQLGKQLARGMVFIVDEAVFPSERCVPILSQGGDLHKLKDSIKARLFVEWFKFSLTEKKLWPRVFKHFLLDLLQVSSFCLQLFLRVALVDYVLQMDPAMIEAHDAFTFMAESMARRRVSLIAIAAFVPCITVLLHVLEHRRTKHWKLSGPLIMGLQSSLLRQFFHLSLTIRNRHDHGEIINAIMSAPEEIVHSGALPVLKLPKTIGNLLVVVAFNCIAAVLFNKSLQIVPLVSALLIYPAIIALLLSCCGPRLGHAMQVHEEMMEKKFESVTSMVTKHQLINDSFKRGKFCGTFEKSIAAHNDAWNKSRVILLHVNYVLTWTTALIAAAYLVIGGLSVLGGAWTIGMVLVNLDLIKSLGSSWGNIFEIGLEVRGVLPAVVRLIEFMNYTTDYAEAAAVGSFRAKRTAELLAKEGDLDLLPIILQGLSDRYSLQTGDLKRTINLSSDVQIPQGNIVHILGEHGIGRTVVTKLLGAQLMRGWEDAERVFVPAHLRITHVTESPIMMNESLMSNLTMAAEPGPDGSTERVLRICKRLGMSDDTMGLVKDGSVHNWDVALSRSERQLISIARSLIANMEMIVLHKPLVRLTPEAGVRVLDILHEFVGCKGVEQDPATLHVRSARTCFISSVDSADVRAGDVLLLVTETGLQVEEVTADTIVRLTPDVVQL